MSDCNCEHYCYCNGRTRSSEQKPTEQNRTGEAEVQEVRAASVRRWLRRRCGRMRPAAPAPAADSHSAYSLRPLYWHRQSGTPAAHFDTPLPTRTPWTLRRPTHAQTTQMLTRKRFAPPPGVPEAAARRLRAAKCPRGCHCAAPYTHCWWIASGERSRAMSAVFWADCTASFAGWAARSPAPKRPALSHRNHLRPVEQKGRSRNVLSKSKSHLVEK